MNKIFGASGAVCISALLTATGAFADVTAQEVWEAWKDQLSIYGENGVTIGSEEMSGGTLTVTGLEFNFDDGEMAVTATLDEIVLTENGDGTVSVTLSEDYPVTIAPSGDDAQNRAVILFKTAGNNMVVSGTADAMTYDISADRYTISLAEMIENGAAVPGAFNLNLNAITGTYMMATGEMRDLSYEFNATSADFLVDLADGSEAVNASGQMSNISVSGLATLPMDMAAANPDTVFLDGMSVDASYEIGQASYLMAVTDDMGTTNITSASNDNYLAFAMAKDSMTFDTGMSNLAMTVVSPQAPFPVDFTLGGFGLGLQMPLSKTEEPAPFASKLSLVDLDMNDAIWGMIDPMAALPHDPVTAELDLSGEGKLFFDILDPEQAAQMDAAPVPGELNSLAINTLNLALLGATLNGSGAFTFDNSDLMTFGGVPRPQGDLSLVGTGINGLLDKLQMMGLIPEDQMMGARMMLGMFATVTGDDQLESKLSIDANGGVFINGQQIR